MTTHQPFFGRQSDWLSHTLNTSDSGLDSNELSLSTGTLEWVAQGMIRFHPKHHSENGLILSAGIHGNETAPIEILNALVSDIIEQSIAIKRPTLFILGHPDAIAAQTRFIDVNLNRLFNGAHKQAEYSKTKEASRAALIEAAVTDFNKLYPVIEHLDLHTAIRESVFERFALYPFRPNSSPKPDQLTVLLHCGIEHLLLQSAPATTFSAFTATHCNSESYTLELGRVKPFGENDLSHYQDVSHCLKQLINDQTPTAPNSTVHRYQVSHEIIHSGPNFEFYIPDDVKNFTAYPKGTVIWKDDQSEYSVQAEEELIVFPNRHVPKGQRAGLMIKTV